MSNGKTRDQQIEQGLIIREKILAYIISYIQVHEIPPTIREIGEAVGISTTSVTAYHLHKLEARGSIERDPKISRGIRVPGLAEGEYSIEYRCIYPFGCEIKSKDPGRCQIHATELIPFVSRRPHG